jgi:hypothetical protein
MSGALWSRSRGVPGGAEGDGSPPPSDTAERAEGGSAGGDRARGRVLLRLARVALAWVLAGVAFGVAWRFLTPVASGWADSYEQGLSGDVTFAVLAVTAGLVAAAVGMLRPGPGAAARFVAAVVGALTAGPVAWGVGLLAGAPTLTVVSVLLLWPLTLAIATVLGSLVAIVVVRDGAPAEDEHTGGEELS